jgi:predicted DsbA family dithiol-disulfide isomerase
LRKDYELTLDWKPFFLRPETPPEGMPVPDYVRERRKDPDNPLKARARALGLTMVEREVLPSTRRAHEAAEFARDRGVLEPMHAALLRRYWSNGEDLYDLQVLRGAASEVGLDPDELQRAIEGQSYTSAVERAVAEAQTIGVRAVPLFVVRDELAIEGAQEERVFRQAFAQLGIAPKPTA